MCPYPDRFENLSVCSGSVKSSSGNFIPIKGKGTVVMDCLLKDGSVSSFRLHDVLYVPQLAKPLFSWKAVKSKGYQMEGSGDVIRVVKNNKTWLEAIFDGSLPRIQEVTDVACLSYDFWHEALCHSAPSSVAKTEKLIQNASVIPPCPENFHCEACTIAKSTHSTPQPSISRAEKEGEYIHSDLCGPFPTPSYSKARYYISFVCDKSRYSWVRFLKNKSDAAQAAIDLTTEIELQDNVKVKRYRTDNGGEFLKEDLVKFFATKGIEHDLTPPYSPESNGVAERLNRSIGEGIRAMLLPLKDKRLWAEAVNTFVYVKNRQTHSAVKGQTPYEAYYGTKPSIDHLQPFGRECYVHIPKGTKGYICRIHQSQPSLPSLSS